MARLKVAVYDSDRTYRERFAAYLMREQAEEMELSVFSSTDYLLEAVRKTEFHLIVLGAWDEEVFGLLSGKRAPTLVLTEEDTKEALSFSEEIAYTPKYRPMDEITRKIYLLTDRRQVQRTVHTAADMDITGVYSPVKHEMQMMFSLLYAKERTADGRTLYLNLMEYSGFYGMFGMDADYDMGDVILRLREKRLCTEEFYRGICKMGDFFVLCPFRNPENLLEFHMEDYRGLLKFISEYTDFKTVIVDFGSQTQDFAEMLNTCKYVYCIEKSGFYFQCRTEEFKNYLEKTMEEAFFERFRTLELPFQAKWIHGGGNLLEQLGWSEFGDYVRRYLEGGIHESFE